MLATIHLYLHKTVNLLICPLLDEVPSATKSDPGHVGNLALLCDTRGKLTQQRHLSARGEYAVGCTHAGEGVCRCV